MLEKLSEIKGKLGKIGHIWASMFFIHLGKARTVCKVYVTPYIYY